MSAVDIILTIILAVLVAVVVIAMIRDKKKGKGCGCGCSGCDNMLCPGRKTDKTADADTDDENASTDKS